MVSTSRANTDSLAEQKLQFRKNGVSVDASGTLSPTTKGASIGLSYLHDMFAVKSKLTAQLTQIDKVKSELAVKLPWCKIGGDLTIQPKTGVEDYSVGVGVASQKASVVVTAYKGFDHFTISLLDTNKKTQFGYKLDYSAKSGEMGMQLGIKHILPDFSFIKAKLDNAGKIALSYGTALGQGSTIVLGLAIDSKRLSENAHSVGIQFSMVE